MDYPESANPSEEAAEAAAEETARRLRDEVKKFRPFGPSRKAGGSVSGNPPLFRLRWQILDLAFRTLLLPESKFEAPVFLEIRQDRTRIIVKHDDRVLWVDLPAENNVPPEAPVLFVTLYGPMAGLGALYRPGDDDVEFEFHFDAAKETLRVHQKDMDLTWTATTAVPVGLVIDDEEPLSKVAAEPVRLRRLLAIAAQFAPSGGGSNTEREVTVTGAEVQAGTDHSWCLLDAQPPMSDINLRIAPSDVRTVSRALRRMHGRETALYDFGEMRAFSDGVVGLAFKPATSRHRDARPGFEREPLTRFEFRGHEPLAAFRRLNIYPRGQRENPLRLKFQGHWLDLALVPSGGVVSGVSKIHGVSLDAEAGLETVEPVEIQVDMIDIQTAIFAVQADWIRLAVMAGPNGQPRYVIVETQLDETRYRVLVPRLTLEAAKTTAARTPAN